MNGNELLKYSVDQLKEAASIREQLQSLEQQRNDLMNRLNDVLQGQAEKGKRMMSEESRKRIAEAQKARWAKFHAQGKNNQAKPEAKPEPKKRGRKPKAEQPA